MWNLTKVMVLAVAFQIACSDDHKGSPGFHDNHYAQGFAINTVDNHIRLTVRNPWEKAQNIEFGYILFPRGETIPDSLAAMNIIRTPVERIICLSTSHLAFLEALGETDKVTGVSGSQFITNPSVRQGISEGKIRDVGYGRNLNFEEIIRQKPDVVMVYGVDSEVTGFLDKFRDLGIPTVLNAEFLEGSPLGKAEWIKFMAAFFNKRDLSDSIFSSVEQNYLYLKGKVARVQAKPAIMTGLPYRDAWWVPGGRSYLANLISDAGGNYVFSENNSHESFVISLEEALTRSSVADFWINTGTITRKEEILSADSRFRSFPMYGKALIYNNNRRSTAAGGNDFWESGTVYPDRILADLIRIFHPGVLPGDTLTYYVEIK